MLIERRMKSFSQQNAAGVSQEKGVTVISQTVETNGDQVSNTHTKNKSIKTIKCLHAAYLK